MIDDFIFREEPEPGDTELVGEMVEASGYFRHDEIEVAKELVAERVARGLDSGYYFWLADDPEFGLAGYACYGPIPCTVGCYDLFWIAVVEEFQGQGLGKKLVELCEKSIRFRGGRRVYVETSGQSLYESTRQFYLHCGYKKAATLNDFYDYGDDKVVFYRDLESGDKGL